MFIGHGRAYRLGEILKLSYGVKLQRDLTIFIGEVDTSRGVNPNVVSPRKDFNLLMEEWGMKNFIFHGIIPALYPLL